MLEPDLKRGLEDIAGDRVSGASSILERALTLLDRARVQSASSARLVGRALCDAHPCMASLWNAAGLATREDGTFEQFAARARRAPRALARVAASLLADAGDQPSALHLITCSRSGSVAACIEALAAVRPVVVACAEGRPLYEGRQMAARLARPGVTVELFTDAAVHLSLGQAAAVLVGADAVADAWFVNKAGTRQLAATAGSAGVPVYVVASKDKFLHPSVAVRVALPEGAATEVWADRPTAIAVRNPYFERVPLDLVAAFITDVGVLGPDDVPVACAAMPKAVLP